MTITGSLIYPLIDGS